jgi:hypothetical protein
MGHGCWTHPLNCAGQARLCFMPEYLGINTSGAFGEAALATSKKGRLIAERNVAGMIDVRMPLPGSHRWLPES